MSTPFFIFIAFWVVFLFTIVMIGGYFMFRKFLKSMPKDDGMSDLDWQDYYIDQTRALWSEESLQFLDELVQPVPELFRDVARRSIAGKIGKIAIEEKATTINQDIIIRGYMMATPARDHKFLISHLDKKQIDYTPYQDLLKVKIHSN